MTEAECLLCSYQNDLQRSTLTDTLIAKLSQIRLQTHPEEALDLQVSKKCLLKIYGWRNSKAAARKQHKMRLY